MERAPPAFDQPLYSPQKIAAVVAELAELGVPASSGLEGTALDAAKLQAASALVSYRQFDTA
jgi:hypothetical protein